MRQDAIAPGYTSAQTIAVLAGSSVMLTMSMGMRQSWGLFSVPITQDLGISVADFMLAIAIQNLVWGATQPIVGAYADKFGSRWVAVLGTPALRSRYRRHDGRDRLADVDHRAWRDGRRCHVVHGTHARPCRLGPRRIGDQAHAYTGDNLRNGVRGFVHRRPACRRADVKPWLAHRDGRVPRSLRRDASGRFLHGFRGQSVSRSQPQTRHSRMPRSPFARC